MARPRRRSRRRSKARQETVRIDRFCAIENAWCQRDVLYKGERSCFLVYPSDPLRSDAMTNLYHALSAQGYSPQTWQRLTGDNIVFRKIIDAIHAHDVLIAEISELNPNVLIEVGYALAVGRDPILLVDKNRQSLSLNILGTKDQCYYGSRQDVLIWLGKYFASRTYSSAPNRVVPLLDGIDPSAEREGHVYYIPASTDDVSTSIASTIERAKKRHSRIVSFAQGDPDDSLFDTFREQARNIAQAEFVIGSLVGTRYKNSVERNATVAVLLGLAVGFGKRVLVLQEHPGKLALDLGTVLHVFNTESDAVRIVDRWFDEQIHGEIPPSPRPATTVHRTHSTSVVSAGTRTQRMRRQRVRIKFLGSPDAHFDFDLMEYFVETPAFDSARNGQHEIFIGRKGAGKSACFRALAVALDADRRVIPVMISPLDLNYEQLASTLDRIGIDIHPNFLYPSFWRFIIYTEIVGFLVDDGGRFIEGSRLSEKHRRRIEGIANELSEPLTLDFSSRIMDTLRQLTSVPDRVELAGIQAEVERMIGRSRLYGLEDALIELSASYPIHLVIDDVDKQWIPSSSASNALLRALLNEINTIRRRFQGRLRATVFLREDMFEAIKAQDSDYSNRSVAELKWTPELLAEVIAARVEHLGRERFDTVDEAWQSIFPVSIRGRETREYLIERTLFRPRDLIAFCQMALEEAQHNRHATVLEEDVLQAEGKYSRHILDAIRTEFLNTYPQIELAIAKFAQGPAVVKDYWSLLDQSVKELASLGETWATSAEEVLRALYQIGFVGLADQHTGHVWYSTERSFEDAFGPTEGRRALAVHPGFYKHLLIRT